MFKTASDAMSNMVCCHKTEAGMDFHCSGETCMAWRWERPLRWYTKISAICPGESWKREDEDSIEWHKQESEANRRGFCGLAGRPE